MNDSMTSIFSTRRLLLWVALFFATVSNPVVLSCVRADEMNAAEITDKPVTYDDHIAGILKRHCLQCHGDSKQEAGLNMASYSGVAGNDDLVVAGRSSASRLLEIIVAEDPLERMPPENDALPKDQVALIKAWIDSGLRENSGSKVAMKREVEFTPTSLANLDDGPPPMPVSLPEQQPVETLRPFPVIALAASPRAPLLAIGQYEQIKLVNTETQEPIGLLAFPEGEPHVLQFSRSGRLLMVAGGRPVQNGVVVLFDVETGKRVAVIGDETDAIVSADISPDERQVAIGGSGRVIKIFSTETGELLHALEKHTDWVTALAFSPDGKLLASADRVGNIHLWDANSGGVVRPLAEHKMSVTALAWRSDSQLLASSGEDGLIVWWEVAKGWPIYSQAKAHQPARPAGVYGDIPNGVMDLRFGPLGELVSCGRDKKVRVWTSGGKVNKVHALDTNEGTSNIRVLPLQSVLTFDGATAITGDSAGALHYKAAK
ncbi:WD domain-containing protein, G-beta repeat-containing protein [Neorhodopirellula lusitana]|uniref:WD domain-containing protein, G-beta repeat-containing protein n=2 Tax=Neorhodopirellula lusitana TaxID=445327 RepID=A0ABY1QIH2_9BACT|nr:WD domain-containing protein, G-beta repeat-containing protein [Neorhodopirellula lusitana]